MFFTFSPHHIPFFSDRPPAFLLDIFPSRMVFSIPFLCNTAISL